MKKLALALCLFCGWLVSCSKLNDENSLHIRIVNQTDKQLSGISIFSLSADGKAEEEKKYGPVAAGSASQYQLHQKAYNIPLVEFAMESIGLFEFRDIRCGTGLSYLEPGRYSLVIGNEGDGPCVRFIKD